MKRLFIFFISFLAQQLYAAGSCPPLTALQYNGAIYDEVIDTLSESERSEAVTFEDVMIRKVKKGIDAGGNAKTAAICFGVDFFNATYSLNVSSTSHYIRHWYKEKTGQDFQ